MLFVYLGFIWMIFWFLVGFVGLNYELIGLEIEIGCLGMVGYWIEGVWWNVGCDDSVERWSILMFGVSGDWYMGYYCLCVLVNVGFVGMEVWLVCLLLDLFGGIERIYGGFLDWLVGRKLL